jgi:hypothetical protein
VPPRATRALQTGKNTSFGINHLQICSELVSNTRPLVLRALRTLQSKKNTSFLVNYQIIHSELIPNTLRGYCEPQMLSAAKKHVFWPELPKNSLKKDLRHPF